MNATATPAPTGFQATRLAVSRGGQLLVRAEALRLAPGEALWIEAPSGAGKSTLLLALARLHPAEGELTLGEQPAIAFSPHHWRRHVTLSLFPPETLGATLRDDLLAPYRLSVRRGEPQPNDEALEEALGRLGLDYPLDRSTGELSQGELSRLALARGLLTRPAVLLLDEPTANLDAITGAMVAEAVRGFCEEGGSAVIAGHGMPWGFARRLRLTDGILGEVTL